MLRAKHDRGRQETISMRDIFLILFITVIFSAFIQPQSSATDFSVTIEMVNLIKRETLAAYPPEFLAEFMKAREIEYEKGTLEPSALEELLDSFSIYLKPGMRFLDLGSGDGRVVFLASLFGVEATGIEYHPIVYQISIDAMMTLKDSIDTKRIQFIKGNFLKYDFKNYDIFYLFEGTNDFLELQKKLSDEMKVGGILITYLVPGSREIHSVNLKLIQEFRYGYNEVKVYKKTHE